MDNSLDSWGILWPIQWALEYFRYFRRSPELALHRGKNQMQFVATYHSLEDASGTNLYCWWMWKPRQGKDVWAEHDWISVDISSILYESDPADMTFGYGHCQGCPRWKTCNRRPWWTLWLSSRHPSIPQKCRAGPPWRTWSPYATRQQRCEPSDTFISVFLVLNDLVYN